MENTDGITAARHLMHRSGFAEPPSAVVAASTLPRSQWVTSRVNNDAAISNVPPPAWLEEPLTSYGAYRQMAPQKRREAQMQLRMRHNHETTELQAWWLQSLIETPNPLNARLTLFWQNHFTSQQRKVRITHLMYQQQQTLMQHANGYFGELLHAMLRDPAMLIYLDNRNNRRDRPNENLARELLELFSLGEGHYNETDIREVARALTGMTIDRDMQFVFRTRQHDDGSKTLLGQSGNFGADDVAELLLKNPATAEFIVGKLWRYFISPNPDPATVAEWADHYRNSNYHMQELMRVILDSDTFNDPAVHGTLVKSPVELVVGTHRLLGLSPSDPVSLIRAPRTMQQTLYEPPNVRGWVGGNHWINSHTLLARRRFVTHILRRDDIDLERITAGLSNDQIVDSVLAIRPDVMPSATESHNSSAIDNQMMNNTEAVEATSSNAMDQGRRQVQEQGQGQGQGQMMQGRQHHVVIQALGNSIYNLV